MRPRRPHSPPRSPRSPQNSSYGNCQRKAKLYSYLVIFGIVVYLEILFLSQWSLDSLLNSRQYDKNQPYTLMGHRSSQTSPPDGTFNGYPVHLHVISNSSHTKPKSSIHCIGENYQEDHWLLRSCSIRFMCFNIKEQEYEIYSRPEDGDLKIWTDQILGMDTSQTLMQPTTGEVDMKEKGDSENFAASVSLGGILPEWDKSSPVNKAKSDELKYFPRVKATPPSTFFALPEDVVMIPFHPMVSPSSNSLMSVLWDDFLSIFNLLHIFQLDQQNYRLLLLRHIPIRDDEDFTTGTAALMMRPPSVLTSRQQGKLELFNSKSFFFAGAENQSDLICAKHGVMGTAGLTSHGTHRTRGPAEDVNSVGLTARQRRRRSVTSKVGMTQNRGRGGIVSKFRSWALQNLDLDESNLAVNTPHKIVLAASSGKPELQNLLGTLKGAFSNDASVSKVDEYDWKSVAPLDQVKILSQTSVLVSTTPQDLATAPFLPSGASLILLYSPKTDESDANEEYWDLINNLSQIRVHWFPLDAHGADGDGAKTLIRLISRAMSYDDTDVLG